MTVTIPETKRFWDTQIEHRTTDSSDPRVDASTNTRYYDIKVKEAVRLLRTFGQPVNGNGGSGEFHYFRKVTKPYGTWRATGATIGEALSVDELTGVDLDSEGSAARHGIGVGTILRITGVVAADTPDSIPTMVVRVTKVTLAAGSKDTIDFQHIWTSVSRACDTAATLEIYDTRIPDLSHFSEDIWRDLNTTISEADDGSETLLDLASEGIAATKGIIAGSILKLTGVLSAVANSEIVLVTGITLTGGQVDRATVVRGYWGTTAIGRDTGATILMLEGQITDLKSLNSVNDNTYYTAASIDDNYIDFGPHDRLRSIVAGAAEARVGALFGQYKGTRN